MWHGRRGAIDEAHKRQHKKNKGQKRKTWRPQMFCLLSKDDDRVDALKREPTGSRHQWDRGLTLEPDSFTGVALEPDSYKGVILESHFFRGVSLEPDS